MSSKKSAIQLLLDELLWDIYGKVSSRGCESSDVSTSDSTSSLSRNIALPEGSWKYSLDLLKRQNVCTLTQICASMRVEIRIIGAYLVRVLRQRDKHIRKQKYLCCIVTTYLRVLSGDSSADTKNMKFSLSPPSPTPKTAAKCDPNPSTGLSNTSSDFNQWLHAMKMVARLPGGMPPEFRRKLWLALADKYLQTRNVDWDKEQEKCFSEQWREDDEELGIQIVKDLHRTGSSLCSGPAGTINQAKLKRVLLGYARWNPEVGYCQGFNMLGALILQVMDKDETESMKVMIYLVEGVLPPGYFNGSLSGLQADMAVFRELMTSKLPALAKHLQKLQGPVGEGTFEPPLTNVFTMQWFLTLFCTCLPINCVLRVWDLVLIEGSDVLLRTALAIWSLLEQKILRAKTADDFYCKMGTLSGELLNGHLIDSNGLIERVVELGPVPELQKLRDKHLYNIAPWRDKKGLSVVNMNRIWVISDTVQSVFLKAAEMSEVNVFILINDLISNAADHVRTWVAQTIFYSDDEGDSDDDSRLAVTTAWGIRANRRGSGTVSVGRPALENKDRIALDISVLKKQYDRLRERQRQAHIILTAAVARQSVNSSPTPSLQMNQLLLGRNAIVTNKGRRIGPPPGAVPPVRKLSVPKSTRAVPKQLKQGETLHWRDTEDTQRRKTGLKWKDVPSSDEKMPSEITSHPRSASSSTTSSKISDKSMSSTSPRSRKRSESSSYSEDSDANSSTSTSLCDDDDNDKDDAGISSLEASPIRKVRSPDKEVPDNYTEDLIKKYAEKRATFTSSTDNNINTEKTESGQIPSIQLTDFTSLKSPNELEKDVDNPGDLGADEDSSAECDRFSKSFISDLIHDLPMYETTISNLIESASISDGTSLSERTTDYLSILPSPMAITSTSQLSPMPDISKFLGTTAISPLPTPSTVFDYSSLLRSANTKDHDKSEDSDEKYDVNEEGVTNEYFERVNIVERPNRLELLYSYNDRDYNSNREKPSNTIAESPELKSVSPVPSLTTKISPKTDDNVKVIDLHTKYSPEETAYSNRLHSPLLTSKVLEPLPPAQFSQYNVEKDNKTVEVNVALVQPSSNNTSSSSLISSHRIHPVVKEKSFSFDSTTIIDKQEPRPTSCPEARADFVENKNPSDRVLKIIEENSMILHRILRKNIPSDPSITDTLSASTISEYSKTLSGDLSPLADNTASDKTPVLSQKEINPIEKYESKYVATRFEKQQPYDVRETTSPSRSRTFDATSTLLRSDDNIADRLASIKNTIKSIDSLCDERNSYKKDKCQRYIDSLFEDSKKPKFKSTTPSIQVTESGSSGQDDDLSISARLRYSRDHKKDISPRRRRDEEREEYESRVRRDNMPKFSDTSSDLPLNFLEDFKKLDSHDIKSSFSDKYDKDDTKTQVSKPLASPCKIFITDDDPIMTPKTTYVPAKVEIRHTTVTSTFYDRYLSQKLERNAKADKSPSSPIITKAYLDSLKPTIITTDRSSRSAENSPSRQKAELDLLYTPTNQKTFPDLPQSDLHVRSCDNILWRLKSSPKESPNDFDSLYKPLKPKEPLELDFHVGLYRSPTKTSPHS